MGFLSFIISLQERLTFHKGPLTNLVKRSLVITNNNSQPVAFKVKTTAPKVGHFTFKMLLFFVTSSPLFSFTVCDPTLAELSLGRVLMCLVRQNFSARSRGRNQILLTFSVMLQALKEEPPLNTKCKDKFLIQSTIITPDKDTMSLADIVRHTFCVMMRYRFEFTLSILSIVGKPRYERGGQGLPAKAPCHLSSR